MTRHSLQNNGVHSVICEGWYFTQMWKTHAMTASFH